MQGEVALGDYQKAHQNFIQLKAAGQVPEVLDLYLGISYLQLDDATAAIELWEDVKNTHPYEAQIRWYLALAYLKNNQPRKAETILTSISSDAYKYKQANSILESI